MKPSLTTAKALVALALLAVGALGQQRPASSSATSASSTSPSPTATSSTPPVLSTYTFTTTLSRGQALPTNLASSASRSGSIYFIPLVTTLPPSSTVPSSTSITPPSSTAAATSTPIPSAKTTLPLDTKLDPTFGVLGALLLITGLPMTFYGHRNRWSSYFIAGYYTLGLVTICIIFKVGVEQSINPPTPTVRGLFLLATIVAGAIGGILSIVFWRAAALLASGLGGFALGLFLQSVRSGGLITSIGLRYILYVPLFGIFFALSCAERIHSLVLALATAITGATAVTLAIDCFTRQGLKEFYIRNLGFDSYFSLKYPPTFENAKFPLVVGMQIELGVFGALVLMGAAFQLRLYSDLRHSLSLLRKSDEERRMKSKAERAARSVARTAKRDLEEWEKRHGYLKTASKPGVMDEEKYASSVFSGATLRAHERKGSLMSVLKGSALATPNSLDGGERLDSPGRAGITTDSDFPFPSEGNRHNSSFMSYLQRGPEKPSTPGDAPPQLELAGIETSRPPAPELTNAEEDKRKLLDEISSIRHSINMLRASSGGRDYPISGSASVQGSPRPMDRTLWDDAGPSATRSLDLSRTPMEPPRPPFAQSFRERTPSTVGILSGATSFLDKSPPASPAVQQQSWAQSSAAHGSFSMSRSTSKSIEPSDRSQQPAASEGGIASSRWGPSSQGMSRSYSETPASTTLGFGASPRLPSAEPAVTPPVPAAAPVLPVTSATVDTIRYERPPDLDSRMPSADKTSQAHQSHDVGELARLRNGTTTRDSQEVRIITKSVDSPSPAVVAARRSLAARRSDSPSTPWTNPGIETSGPSGYVNRATTTTEKPKRRSMTIEELDARHRAKLAALQKPASDSVREAEMLQSVKSEYEERQKAEKRRMLEKERERQQALNALSGGAVPKDKEGPTDIERRKSRRLSAPLLEAVGEKRQGARGVDRAAEWRLSISKLSQEDPALGRSARPRSQLVSPTTSAPGHGDGNKTGGQRRDSCTQSQRRSGQLASPTNPFPPQSPKKRELSETDRRRLSQGAGGGDRRSRRMSQALLDFTLPAPAEGP
ncbi:hypothetical protein ACQY0O_000267 [Thecaphora frezii]